ncbi:MAG: hypothetical protein JXR61_06990, partial [Prolixibacteraceae bacterium]|nr:hypothetical protein [Prolixibacteraceae bacterium]
NRSYYLQRRERLLNEIYRWIDRLENEWYIIQAPTEAQYMEMDAKKREIIKKDIELFANLKEFKLKGEAVTDTEISLTIGRLSRRYDYFDRYNYESYKVIRNEIVKTEKLISGKGFSPEDDLDKIIETFEKEVEQLREQMTWVLSDERRKEVMHEVQEKKSALQVEGKSVAERVMEFAKLNSLLAYHNRKEAIKRTARKEVKSNDIALLEAEAMAELMLLELLEL